MLRFQYAINLALATVLVVPAVTLGTDQNASLESALARTLQSLEQLASIEHRLQEKDPGAIHDALLWTEAPLSTPESNPGARDELLVGLRGDVTQLESDLDRFQADGTTDPSSPPALLGALDDDDETTATQAPATTGLDDAMRRVLGAKRAATLSTTAASNPIQTSTAPGSAAEKRNFEPDGYAADGVKLGRLYYRQGQFQEALTSFETERTNVEALYWRARCLEKLGAGADAIAAYGEVIAHEKAGALAERAKEDLDFLRWRLEFEKSLAPRGGNKE